MLETSVNVLQISVASSPTVQRSISSGEIGARQDNSLSPRVSLMMETLVAQMPAAFNLINSRSSDGSAVAPLYQPMGYWPQPQNPSYPVGSAFVQQWPKNMGRPLNSLSMDFQTRNTNSLTRTKALPSPNDNLSLFPTSMGSSGVQQQQRVNASQQPSLQPTQLDFIHTPDHCGGRPPPTSTYYSPSSAPQRPSFPIYSHSNVVHDRPFKCDQCPQSFNRNHDLKRHKRVHLAVKPFPCGHCEKSFSRKDALKRHIRVKGCGQIAIGGSNANVDAL